MRKYTFDQYNKFVEESSDAVLKHFMLAEKQEIINVSHSHNKTFIDLGAGYGRVLPILSEIAKNVVSIEMHPEMLLELKKRTDKYTHCEVIVGDITQLSNILENTFIQNPVLLLLQNTFGTIEGNSKEVLSEMKKVAKENFGEIIISFFRSEALLSWGVPKLYTSLSEMVGEVDWDKTSLDTGIFVSKTGYVSRWSNKQEIEEMKTFFGGKLINEIWTDEFCILHIQF